MKDVRNATFDLLANPTVQPSPLKTTSRDKEFLTGHVTYSSQTYSQHRGNETVFQIASITKTFAAAALVKMASSPKYSRFFNSDDPLATPISQFFHLLESPQNEGKQELTNTQKYLAKLALDYPDFSKITLRHLLNHSSGIRSSSTLDEFRTNQTRFLHQKDYYVAPEFALDGFGKFHYCDSNYNNLLLPIMEAIATTVNKRPISFSEVIKEQVINPLQLQKTFLFDEMEYDREKNLVRVKNKPQVKVAQGLDYFRGKVTSSQDFNYDSAAGGMYSTSSDVAKFYQSLLDGSLLGEVGSRRFFDPQNFISSDDNSYGLGIRKTEHQGREYFYHGGAGIGFYSHAAAGRDIQDKSNVTTAVTLLSYENITRPLATALLGDEKTREENGAKIFFNDEILTAKMQELHKKHSQDQLISMRQELEKMPKNFEERSRSFQDLYAQKFSDKSPSPISRPTSSYQPKSSPQKHH